MEPTLIGIGIQTVALMAGGFAMVIRADTVTKNLKAEMMDIQAELKSLANVVTQLAVQTTRLDSVSERLNILDRRVDDMRHGQGFVQHKADREY